MLAWMRARPPGRSSASIPHGDGFLSVRSGPGGRGYSEIDRVFNGDKVNICDRAGDWLAIIYDHHGSDCDVHRPRSVRQVYTGPCQAGWVFRRYVANIGSASPPVVQADPPSDTSECENLWRERNAIYKSAGFCFKTSRAISVFGNAGCSYDNIGDVPLSENQRRTVARIVSEERSSACSP